MSETEKRRGSGLRIFLIMTLVAVALALAAGAAALFGYQWLITQFDATGPQTADGAPRTITVERGESLKSIAADLETSGAISDARLFELAVRIDEGASGLKAGEYAIPSGASINDIYAQIRDGDVVLHALTVPEGMAAVQVADIINAAAILTGDPVEPPAEGSVLPETYLFQRGMTRSELLAEMQAAQRRLLDQLWPQRRADLPIDTREEAIILASIVEKETGLAEERPRIAGVFVNRLRLGMRLESDPTIIYAITQGRPLGRGIRRSEIDAVTDWNTYQIDGLPKTPIANPGADAIRAVLNPPDTADLFFVADGTGGHAFATSYREHQRNVANWRRIERSRSQ